VTAGEVDAVMCAEAAKQRLNDVVAMGPMIESVAEELAEIRRENNFAAKFRSAFEGGGG
jgi:hypothetical protein